MLKLLNTFTISQRQTLVGFMVYGREVNLIYKFGEILTSDQARTTVTSLQLQNPGLNLLSALKDAKNKLFSTLHGARTGVPKSLLIFNSMKTGVLFNDIKEQSDQLKALGVKIIVVGIGSDIDKNELKEINTAGDSFFFPADLTEIDNFVEPVTKELLPGWPFILLFYFI